MSSPKRHVFISLPFILKCFSKPLIFLFSDVFSLFFFILSPFLNCTFEFYAQVLLKLILSSGISQLPINHRFSSIVLWAVSLYLKYSGLKMGWFLITTTTLSRLIESLMEMLVNTHAALTTVKGKMKQLFTLELQVNIDLLLFLSVSILIF